MKLSRGREIQNLSVGALNRLWPTGKAKSRVEALRSP